MFRILPLLCLILFSCSIKTESTTTADSLRIAAADSARNIAEQDSIAQLEAEDREEEPDLYATRAANMAQEIHTLYVTVDFLGFSPDLQYAAYTTTERGPAENAEGDAGYRGGCFIKTVDKNKPAVDSLFADVGDKEPEQLTDSLNRLGMTDLLKQFNITGDNKGKFFEFPGDNADNDITINGEKYTLRLIHHPVYGGAMGFDLVAMKGKGFTLLQQDSGVPVSRGEGIERYYTTGAYVNGNKIAVIIEFDLAKYQVEGLNFVNRKGFVVTGVVKQ